MKRIIALIIAIIIFSSCTTTKFVSEGTPDNPTKVFETVETQTPTIEPTLNSLDALEATSEAKSAFHDDDFLTIKTKFLTDPNFACVSHRGTSQLTCLDQAGWRVYDAYFTLLYSRCPGGQIILSRSNSLYIQQNDEFSEIPNHYRDTKYLACGGENDFWVNYGSSLSHFIHGERIDYRASDILKTAGSGFNDEMAVAPNGNLWVFNNQSIIRFDGTTWQVFDEGEGFEDEEGAFGTHIQPAPFGLVIDKNNQPWFTISKGLLMYDGSRWNIYEAPDKFFPGNIILGKENRIWVSGSNSSISIFDLQTSQWIQQFDGEAIEGHGVNQMQFDKQNRLWVTTTYGLYIFDGTKWNSYHTFTSDLLSNGIDGILVNGDGPELPEQNHKNPGSVRGSWVDPKSPMDTKTVAEICPYLAFASIILHRSPCYGQPFIAQTTLDAEGNFQFNDIPVGEYFLYIHQEKDTWNRMVLANEKYHGLGPLFEILPGQETVLGALEAYR